jgi:hypothetical protein
MNASGRTVVIDSSTGKATNETRLAILNKRGQQGSGWL